MANNITNFAMMLDNTLRNVAAAEAGHAVPPATPALRVPGNPTPFANADLPRSNSLISETNMLIDLYWRALAYASQHTMDVSEEAVRDILLTVYAASKGVARGR